MEEKPFYKSLTFYGALLVGVYAALEVAQGNLPVLKPFVAGLGATLTIFGFRNSKGDIKKLM